MLNNNPMHGTGISVFVWSIEENILLTSYISIYQATKTLSADFRTIKIYLDSGKIYKKKYYLTSSNNSPLLKHFL